MSQLILNVNDNSKLAAFIDFLKTINYVSFETVTKSEIEVSEYEKNVMRKRKQNATPQNFTNWDDIKNSLDID